MDKYNYNINSVEKVFKLLEIMVYNNGIYSVTELSNYMDCSISSINRFLSTLSDLGYAVKDSTTGKYYITNKLPALSMELIYHNPLRTKYGHLVKTLSRKYSASVNLVTMADDKLIMLYAASAIESTTFDYNYRPALPAYCTSTGRVMLSLKSPAELDKYMEETKFIKYQENTVVDADKIRERIEQIRRDRYDVYCEEFDLGTFAIAFPVKPIGPYTACVSLVVPVAEKHKLCRKEIIESIKQMIEDY